MDVNTMDTYLKNWRLKDNPDKTGTWVFLLNNRESKSISDFKLGERRVKHDDDLKYLSITLDRSQTSQPDLDMPTRKVSGRINLINTSMSYVQRLEELMRYTKNYNYITCHIFS